MNIILADIKHKPELITLWTQTFGDSPEFVSGFLDAYMLPEYNVPAAVEDGKLSAALYMIDFPMYCDRVLVGDCAYLYAAATRPDMRGKGLMSALISHSLELYSGRGAKAVFLIPAEKELFSFYERFGFSRHYRCGVSAGTGRPSRSRYSLTEIDIRDTSILDAVYDAYRENAVTGKFVPLKGRYYFFRAAETYIDDRSADAKAGLLSLGDEKICYLFYRIYNNKLLVDDIIVIGDKADKEASASNALIEHLNTLGVEWELRSMAGGVPSDFAMLAPLSTEVERAVVSGSGAYISMFMN